MVNKDEYIITIIFPNLPHVKEAEKQLTYTWNE